MGLGKPVRCLLLLAVVFGCMLVRADGRESRHRQTRDCNPSSIARREIPNFHYVDRDLYRGGHPRCAGLLELERLGVRTFIDLGGAEAALHDCLGPAKAAGMQFISFKISVPDVALFGVSDERLRSLFALMQRAPKPIFISCSLGRDRTGLVTALYRMKRGEMSFDEAREEAIYYGYRTRFIGLRNVFDRYRDPQELKLLPAPARTDPPPESVCRAKALLTSAGRF